MFIVSGRNFQLSELADKKAVEAEIVKEQGGGVKRKLAEITEAFQTLSDLEITDRLGNAVNLDDDKSKEIALKIKSIKNVQHLMAELGVSSIKSLENEI